MTRIRYQYYNFKFDEGRFTKVISDLIIDLMLESAAVAFRETFHRVPVWTGESRGGLRATARALGLENLLDANIKPRTNRKKINRFGQEKSPFNESITDFVPPKRIRKNRIEMFIKNEADGFFYADTRNADRTKAFKFAAGFTFAWRRAMKEAIAREPNLPVNKFTVRQRRVSG